MQNRTGTFRAQHKDDIKKFIDRELKKGEFEGYEIGLDTADGTVRQIIVSRVDLVDSQFIGGLTQLA